GIRCHEILSPELGKYLQGIQRLFDAICSILSGYLSWPQPPTKSCSSHPGRIKTPDVGLAWRQCVSLFSLEKPIKGCSCPCKEVTAAERCSGKQLFDRCTAFNNLNRPAERTQVFLARIDLQRLVERAEQIGDRDGPILHAGAVFARGADD